MPEGLEGVTAETLEAFKKAQSSGVLASTGIYGVDLSGLVSLVPVNVPARNNTAAFPRQIAGEGDTLARWRALLNINNQQSDIAVGTDFAGPLNQVSEINAFAPYKPMAEGFTASLDAVAFARNYANAQAVAQLMALNQLFIGQDLHIINSQNWPLGAPSQPSAAAFTTGGSIAAATTVYVKVCAKSGWNYFTSGGNSPASAVNSINVGSTTNNNLVESSVVATKGAVAYDWYVGSSAGTLYYYTTTTVGRVNITSIPVAAQAIPTSLPLLTTTAPPSTPPTADTSFSANCYNGVLASSLGDYGALGPVTPGTGTPTSCSFIDNSGNAPQLVGGNGVDVLDNLNALIWANVQLSPTAYMMNSLTAAYISQLVLGTSAAFTVLPPTDADARTNLAGGGYVARYINRAAGGVPVAIEIHPRMAPGTIMARTDRVPFPGSNIGTAYEVRCQYDTMMFQYAANRVLNTLNGGPRYDGEIRSMETLINYAPGAQGVITNIATPGTANAS